MFHIVTVLFCGQKDDHVGGSQKIDAVNMLCYRFVHVYVYVCMSVYVVIPLIFFHHYVSFRSMKLNSIWTVYQYVVPGCRSLLSLLHLSKRPLVIMSFVSASSISCLISHKNSSKAMLSLSNYFFNRLNQIYSD